MDLIDDVDLEWRREWQHRDMLAELADIVYAAVRGRVDLIDVLVGCAGFTGQDARHGSLAGAARAREEVGMGQALAGDGLLQGFDDVVLSDDFGPFRRAVGAIEDGHG